MATISDMSDLSILFYATSAALFLLYIFFSFRLKTSIHLLSLGISTGFFIVLNFIHSHNFTFAVILNIIIAGIVGTARLHLKAHMPREVYLGYFLGFTAPFGVYLFL